MVIERESNSDPSVVAGPWGGKKGFVAGKITKSSREKRKEKWSKRDPNKEVLC